MADKYKFRTLRADEIECRVGKINDKGATILLYKDARCDMNILDETDTVGPMNWQREHSRDNANCVVSLWDAEKKMWIRKEDTGTESQTEAEKGLASDSFKRACFNWGIGRELYTAPFIWLANGKQCTVKTKENGKKYIEETLRVDSIEYSETRKIISLRIVNATTGAEIYKWAQKGANSATKKQTEKDTRHESGDLSREEIVAKIEAECKRIGRDSALAFAHYKLTPASAVDDLLKMLGALTKMNGGI